MSEFFIKRPIFAWVIAIIIMLAGVMSILSLPISQYPTIALPQVVITANYPGASADTVANTVTQVIEKEMNGLDHYLYMTSASESTGTASINITFAVGADSDIAQVQVQNKLQKAMPLLPQEVQRQGIAVQKTTASFLLVAGFVSEDNSMDDTAIFDYVATNIEDTLARLEGVGELQMFGSAGAMRIWIDPVKLNNFNLTIGDINDAIRSQNAQVPAGKFGGTPQIPDQRLDVTITSQTLLETEEEFRNILLRVNPNGATLRLGQVARIERGLESYDFNSRYNAKPACGLAVKLSSNANALKTAGLVKETLANFAQYFPPGLKVVYPYDTAPFVILSIEEVVKTLIEAIVLVFCLMFLFLQNFRATLIPTIAVPVVLLGTFGVLAAAGFTINTLTMFGMVLAIGLLVDDAIVVVENVERLMHDEHLDPITATSKSMRQISGALVGIGLVLSAVFVPMAFFGGSTGVIFRQFSITIASAMILSVFVALVLTPALCATMLKPIAHGEGKHRTGLFSLPGRIVDGFFSWFNRSFASGTNGYVSGVKRILRTWPLFIVIYGALLLGVWHLFDMIPASFLPDEDQGVMFVEIQGPAGSTRDNTLEAIKSIERYLLDDEKETIKSVFAVVGYGFSGSGQNSGLAFVSLRDWKERNRPDLSVKALAARANRHFQNTIRNAMVFAFPPPAVTELGNASGFDLQLLDTAGLGHNALLQARNKFLYLAGSDKYQHLITRVRPNGKEDTPQYQLEVDYSQAFSMGVSLTDIQDLLRSGWGSAYLNDFLDKGEVKRVYIQAEPSARMTPEDLEKWYIRNSDGKMMPFSLVTKGVWHIGSPRLERYNGIPSMEILGEPMPGVSTGQAMAAAEEIAKELPEGIRLSWTGLSLQEKQSGEQTTLLYSLSALAIFLCLAALYESWSIPVSVMLVVPLGIVGVQLGAILFKQSNDVYFQVGFLTIIGLSARNAILIVEFAKELHDKGADLVAASLEACRLRLRPIMMTSLTFVLGVLPLATSTGAGAGSQNAIGIGVIGGMLTNTFLGIFLIPLFFFLIVKIFSGDTKKTGLADSGETAD